MKKTILFLLTLILAGTGFAQKAPTVKLLSNTEDRTVVNVQLNGFSTIKANTPNGDQFIIQVPKMSSMLETGAPDLPIYPVPVIIGDCAEMTVNVIDAQYTDYTEMDIAPSKGNLSRQVNPDEVPFTYGEMYRQDAFWPATQAYLEAPYILRDFRGQNIMVRPFAYNPVTRTLRVYDNLTIEMKKVSDNGTNQKAARKSNTLKTDPEQKAQYRRRFINFDATQAKYNFDEDYGELLIICTDAYMANLQPLVEWKNQSGRPTTLVSLSEAGGNNIENIKSYVNNFYSEPDHNLEYVLLVGEYNDITPKNLGYGDGGTVFSDNYIGKLEGNDNYLEVLVGRLSVANAADADVQVNKILFYERDVMDNINWGNRGLGIGHSDGPGHYGECDYQHIDFIRDTLMHYTYGTVTDIHGGSAGNASTTNISAAINEGISIINYCNHGSETSWGVAGYSNSNVNTLTNDYMLPFVWSVACLNGKFDVGTCFAESWMRATDNSTGAPTGAVGGMFSFVSQPWQPPMYGQDEMVDILAEWRHVDQFNHTFGGASLNGSMDIIDRYPNDSYQTFNSWILFGDPSMLVRTANPVTMNVTANPSVLMTGMNELVVNADTDYGIATLSFNGEVLSTTKVTNGTATLTFPSLDFVGTAQLTVIGFNKVSYQSEIEIVPAEGPYLVLNDYEVASNDGVVNYGDEAMVNIGVRNVGVESVSDVIATLSTESEYVTEFLNNTATVSNIEPGEIVNIENEFHFVVANNTPDGTKIPFHLVLDAVDQTWQAAFNITVNAPALVLSKAEPDGELMGGGQGNLVFAFKNEGHATAPTESLNVFSSSSDIALESNVFEVNAIQSSDSVFVTVPLTIAEGVETGSCYEISYLLNAEHYSISGSTVISIGTVTEDFETGDFSAFSWEFEGSQDWTIDSTNAYQGTYCAKSGAITHSQSTRMILRVNIPAGGEISFFKKVSSENNYDKLTFLIDNNQKGQWSGNQGWTQESYPIEAGRHVFTWDYTKDVSVSSGQDCAWIDNIQLPATGLTQCAQAVTELTVVVNENDVTLEWAAVDRAAAYLLYRDGAALNSQEGTSYTEAVEHGVYTYSVVVLDEEGHYSEPTYATVNVISFMETEETLVRNGRVFPNPTEGLLNIEFEGAYSFILFNSFGQQVMSGKAEGRQQLHLEDLAKGVYVLRIHNSTADETRKVIVK